MSRDNTHFRCSMLLNIILLYNAKMSRDNTHFRCSMLLNIILLYNAKMSRDNQSLLPYTLSYTFLFS